MAQLFNNILSFLYDINSSPPAQNGCQLADNIFKCISVNENFCILLQMSLKFVPKGSINNMSALVQVMAWRKTGDRPLPEPWWPSSLVYMCGTRGRWVNEHCVHQDARWTNTPATMNQQFEQPYFHKWVCCCYLCTSKLWIIQGYTKLSWGIKYLNDRIISHKPKSSLKIRAASLNIMRLFH